MDEITSQSQHRVFSADSYVIDHFSREGEPRLVVVTFTERGSRELEGVGYAGKFILDLGFDLIAVKTKSDNWYQDMPKDAASAISRFLGSRFPSVRRAGYGSSMGAYAAVKLSRQLRLDAVFAISPLVDIAQDWDTRWHDDSVRLPVFQSMTDKDIWSGCAYTIAYDPFDIDALHAARLADIIPSKCLHTVRTPFSGHPAGYFLSKSGYLKLVAEAALTGAPTGQYSQPLRSQARLNETYLFNLSQTLLSSNKTRWAAATIRKALDADCLNPEYNMRASGILERAGDLDAAVIHASIAVGQQPDHPHMMAHLARVLLRRGRMHAALLHIERALAFHPESEVFRAIRQQAVENGAD
jgi:hypothetical protein